MVYELKSKVGESNVSPSELSIFLCGRKNEPEPKVWIVAIVVVRVFAPLMTFRSSFQKREGEKEE